MKNLSQEHQGYLYGFLSTTIFSFYPIINLLGFGRESIFLLLSGSGGLAAIVFAIHITLKKQWKLVLQFNDWKNFFGMFVFINVLFYGIYLYGNLHTNAGSTSIASLGQVLFSFLFLWLLKYEKFTFRSIFGAILMVIGAMFILWKKDMTFDIGVLIVFLSFMFTPVGNIFQKKLRSNSPSIVFLFLRNIGVFLSFGLGFFVFDKSTFNSQYEISSWLIMFVFYGFFFWYLEKQFWTETLHRIPIAKASLFMIVAPPMTMIFAYFILHEIPTYQQLLGFLPMAIGTYLVLKKDGFKVLKG